MLNEKGLAETQAVINNLQAIADRYGMEGQHGAATAIATACQLARSMLLGRLAAERRLQEIEKADADSKAAEKPTAKEAPRQKRQRR
jgi:hypothetical protein